MSKKKTFRISYSADSKAGIVRHLKSKEECYEFINNNNLDMALILDGDTQEIIETYVANKHKSLFRGFEPCNKITD
jgi:hypothetical protein